MLTKAIEEYRHQYAKLDFINIKFSSSKEIQEFNLHNSYVDSIANSLLRLAEDPQSNIVAISALMRMLAESTAIFKLLMQSQEPASRNNDFIKAFRKGGSYPSGYAEIVQSLAIKEKDRQRLKAMYHETSRVTHFSSRSLSLIENPEYYKVAISWCEYLFRLMTLSISHTVSMLEDALSNKAARLLKAELKANGF